jgi:hypothetical protein
LTVDAALDVEQNIDCLQRRHEHPVRHLAGFTRVLQADAYGYNELYDASRAQGQLLRRYAGLTPGGSSLSWRTSRRLRGATGT